MTVNPLVEETLRILKALGFQDIEVIRHSDDPMHFGNAEAVMRIGRLLLRFQRDRGQDFVDLASVASPERFYRIEDVDVALGWKSVGEVVARQDPESIASILNRVRDHIASLEDAFSAEKESLTRARIEQAAKERGQAVLEKFHR